VHVRQLRELASARALCDREAGFEGVMSGRHNAGMSPGSFTEYLAGLGEPRLTLLLRVRPDVRIEPVPRGFEQLAQRLGGPDSMARALRSVNRDAIVVGQAVAALGPSATVEEVAGLLGAPTAAVEDALNDLCSCGLAWLAAEVVRLPERLAMHWSAEIGGGRPAATIARTVLADDLRSAVEALGYAVSGLRKPELTAQLVDALSDIRSVIDRVRRLPGPAREHLEQLRRGYGSLYPRHGGWTAAGGNSAERALAAAGLVLRVNHQWEVPREVAVAAWSAEQELPLTGRPELPRAAGAGETPTGQPAAQDILRAVSTLLDEAAAKGIAALKKGGIGTRERARLATRLALPAETLQLAIDLAAAAGLMSRADAGYAPTEQYQSWHDAQPADQWAALAVAWFELPHAPTSREVDGDKEVPPPLPLESSAGPLRRALLRAAGGGLSMRSVGEHIDWFFPTHGYDITLLRVTVAAALREAELMGVVAADGLTECGAALMAAVDDASDEVGAVTVVVELADRLAGVLAPTPCTVILQSDLTAVVSGQPTTAVMRVLGVAAVSESRGTAAVWRFSPASIRTALDTGWSAAQLLGELAAIADRPLPQPLEYLVNDVARRHGLVRVRGMRSCVLADESTVTEILHTRSLAKLQLARLAPTALSSPFELDEVLARLRAAGLSPVAEDALGGVVVEVRREHRATNPRPPVRSAPRTRVSAGELAARLLADPTGASNLDSDSSDTFDRLAELNAQLGDAELMLLADAVEHQREVLIGYRTRTGGRTLREIRPHQLYGRWLESWCHLRNAQREFTVANIESVAPVR
jgi:hypothetical protein